MLKQDTVRKKATPRSKRAKKKLLALAGAWNDLDTEALKREIYRSRHESPPGPPAEL